MELPDPIRAVKESAVAGLHAIPRVHVVLDHTDNEVAFRDRGRQNRQSGDAGARFLKACDTGSYECSVDLLRYAPQLLRLSERIYLEVIATLQSESEV